MDYLSVLHWRTWAKRDLSSGTCRNVCEYEYIPELFRCSECGHGYRVLDLDSEEEVSVNICPHCHAEVVK